MTDGTSVTPVQCSVSQSVVDAIARAEGVDPVELTPPLYEVVDPDALNGLFDDTHHYGRLDREVVFTYKGYEVTVDGDGSVSVGRRNE